MFGKYLLKDVYTDIERDKYAEYTGCPNSGATDDNLLMMHLSYS